MYLNSSVSTFNGLGYSKGKVMKPLNHLFQSQAFTNCNAILIVGKYIVLLLIT